MLRSAVDRCHNVPKAISSLCGHCSGTPMVQNDSEGKACDFLLAFCSDTESKWNRCRERQPYQREQEHHETPNERQQLR